MYLADKQECLPYMDTGIICDHDARKYFLLIDLSHENITEENNQDEISCVLCR